MELIFGSLSLSGLSLSGITPTAIAWILAAVCLAGFLRGFLGFGGSLLISMVANVAVGPHFAVPLACLSGLPTTAQLLPDAIRHADRGFITPFGITSIVFIPLGTIALISIDAATMKVIVSLCVLAMVLFLFVNWGTLHAANRALSILSGIAAGLIQGAAGVGGPPAVAVAMAFPGSPERRRGNVIGAVTFLGTAPVVPLWYHGLFTWQVITMSLAVIPVYVFTTWIGRHYFARHGRAHYKTAALLALAAISVVTLVVALHDYVQA